MTKDRTPSELQQTEVDEVNGAGDVTMGDLIIVSVRDRGDNITGAGAGGGPHVKGSQTGSPRRTN